MPIDSRILSEHTILLEALKVCIAGLAVQVVYLTASALDLAVVSGFVLRVWRG